jgi:uncharacterized protein
MESTPDTTAPYESQTEETRPAFQRWLDPARPNAKVWRVLVGAVIVVSVWVLWTALVIGFFLFASVHFSYAAPRSVIETLNLVVAMSTPMDTAVLLSTYAGIWIGVWLAMRLLHRQKFVTLFSPERRVRWGEFGIGMALVSGYLALSTLLTIVSGDAPARTNVGLVDWLKALPLVAPFIFLQSSGEEIFFRGYLVQQLGARFRSPFVWGLLPALLFGLGHFANAPTFTYGVYYVAATMLIGLTATALIWRTGSLSAAMGLHVANNLVAFLVAGPSDAATSTQLWSWTVGDLTGGAFLDLASLGLLLAYVLSPWAPLGGTPLWGLRKEIRAAP